MAYTTGSGDYTAMMAAVLSHAIADGWTEVGGVSSGWPIQSPTSGLYADWATDTSATTDVTAGGIGISTQRNIRMGVDFAASATATSEAATNSIHTPNANFSTLTWHIFSDTTVSDHVLVAFEFTNGVDSSVWGHFGFGMLDQYGLTHGGVAFCGGQYGRGWAVATGSGSNAGDWNSLNRTNIAYAGRVGETDDGNTNLDIKINATSHPIPSPGPGVGGWPATGTSLLAGQYTWATGRMKSDLNSQRKVTSGNNVSINWNPAVGVSLQPFSGAVSLMPQPIFLINGATSGTSGSSIIFVGQIPNWRLCALTGFSPGDEVTYGSDTWKLFPMLCQKDDSTLNVTNIVTSGQAGFAYKKVT